MVPFLHVTTRIEGRAGDDLLSDKADRMSFPTLMVMDKDGNVVARHSQDFSVAQFRRLTADAQAVVDWRVKAATGDKNAKAELALAEVRSGVLDFYDLEERLEGLELTDAQKTMVARLELEASVLETAMVLRKTPRAKRPDAMADAGSDFVEAYEAGLRPVGRRAQWIFWNALAEHASKTGNAKLLGDLVKVAEGMAGGDAAFEKILKRYRSELADVGK